MILTFLLLLLFSKGLTVRPDTSFLYSRIGLIIVFYSILSAYTTFHITCLETGLALYGGLFNATRITHSFQVFILMISGIILMMTGFYTRKKSIGDPVSFMVILFKKVKQYVNTFTSTKAANLQILYVTYEYIKKCPDDLFFSLETLFLIFIFLLNAFIFTFISEKMEYNIDRGRAFINLVFDNFPFIIIMIVSLCGISYFGRADVFCFFKHTINMSFYGCLLANYLVFLLPCAITIQFISSLYFEDKHFNYDIINNLCVVLGKAIIGIKIENFILYTMIVLFVSVFKAPMWFFLLFCTIGISLILTIEQKYEITKTIPLNYATCWPLLCVAIGGIEVNLSSEDLPDPIKDDLIQQGYTFKDNDYNCNVLYNLYVLIDKYIARIKVEYFILNTILLSNLTILFNTPSWFFTILCIIGFLIIITFSYIYKTRVPLHLEATNGLPLHLKATNGLPLMAAAVYTSSLYLSESEDSLNLAKDFTLDNPSFWKANPELWWHKSCYMYTKQELEEIGFIIANGKAYPPKPITELFTHRAGCCSLPLKRSLIQISENLFFRKNHHDFLLQEYVYKMLLIDYCTKLYSSTLDLDPEVKDNINILVKRIADKPNDESHVKGLTLQFFANSIFKHFLITGESRTKGNMVMDFLVEQKHNNAQKPLCCVEVKSPKGEGWVDLITQGRNYAVDVCKNSELNTIFVICVKGTHIAFFVYQENFSDTYNLNQNFPSHKNMIGFVLDNEGTVRPMPQANRMFTQFDVLDLANHNQLKVAQVLGKYISNRTYAPIVEKASNNLGEYWVFRPNLDYISDKNIEISSSYFMEREDLWKRVWNLNKDKLISEQSLFESNWNKQLDSDEIKKLLANKPS